MTPKSDTESTTEVTTVEEKTENQPNDKPNALPMTQMPSPIPKRTFCSFMILSNAVRCFTITDNHRNNHIEKGKETSMTPKPKIIITTGAAILIEKTDNHPGKKSNVSPMTRLSSPSPKRSFCSFMIRNRILPSSIIKCYETHQIFKW